MLLLFWPSNILRMCMWRKQQRCLWYSISQQLMGFPSTDIFHLRIYAGDLFLPDAVAKCFANNLNWFMVTRLRLPAYASRKWVIIGVNNCLVPIPTLLTTADLSSIRQHRIEFNGDFVKITMFSFKTMLMRLSFSESPPFGSDRDGLPDNCLVMVGEGEWNILWILVVCWCNDITTSYKPDWTR